MLIQTLLSVAAVAGLSLATPVPAVSGRATEPSAASIIAQIMPSSNSCSGAQFPDECRTADQAAPFLIKAMVDHGVKYAGEIAGILALVGYESVDMKYKHNVVPGRPGQGTSNMQMVNYNRLYAASIPALADKVKAATDDNAVLALVQPDEYNFGSGPWFLTTQCTPEQRNQLSQGTDDGFRAYMSCVGVEVTDDRLAYWTRAKQAFGL
ncbi:hypothetical protein VTK73DRAFT_7621 [Phialemonium thermophilum]|uniref:Uncharacterized protein n=1 Tax=Phialemonium thermophilum TaxID=223376 RepID=A0ABR3Y702_9PEZI